MKKTIKDYALKNKKVLIRCDFNVPIINGKITDDNRIKESLPTIQYAIKEGAKIILFSHLGRVKTVEDKKEATLKPVAIRLSELLGQNVLFVPETRGNQLEEAITQLKSGEVLLVENTRFEDIDGKKESNNDLELGNYWASFGDLFINDAFGTAHRCHASNVGIASHLESGIGLLMEKELTILEKTLENPAHPFSVILGGSKVSDKIGVVANLITKADYLLIGGGMCFTFLKAEGVSVGSSLVEEEQIPFCKELLEKYPDKIILPVDVICGLEIAENTEVQYRKINEIKDTERGLDIGSETVSLFQSYLEKSQFILWNGTLGVSEIKAFAFGTEKIATCLSQLKATTVIGGGDTAAAIIGLGLQDKMTHVSTGGGATLEWLEGKTLSGVAAISDK